MARTDIHEYLKARRLVGEVDSFEVLITATILKADPSNLRKLALGFPEIVAEMRQRYNNPGELLPGETHPDGEYRLDDGGNLVEIATRKVVRRR